MANSAKLAVSDHIAGVIELHWRKRDGVSIMQIEDAERREVLLRHFNSDFGVAILDWKGWHAEIAKHPATSTSPPPIVEPALRYVKLTQDGATDEDFIQAVREFYGSKNVLD